VTHAEMDDLYGLYSLGALDFNAAVEIDSHLADGCEYCLQQIRQAINVTAGLSGIAEPVQPPPALRSRVLAMVQGERSERRPSVWRFAFASAALACAALAVFSGWALTQSRGVRQRLVRVLADRDQLRSALQILTEQQTRSVRFGAENGSGSAHGFLFVNREGGFVFVGSQLPSIASDHTFELWLVPGKGNPAPAGVFRPDSQGRFVLVSQRQISPAQYAAVALSVEPAGGSPAPTTKPFLIVPLKE
jgi:anti-sigma-K factor RskA